MTDEATIALWQSLAVRAGRSLDGVHVARLGQFLDLLLAANERMNLTRIRDRSSAEIEHVADALTLLRHLPRESVRLADVGSGGGVPGIVLAIARPDCSMALVESIRKKADFLKMAVAALSLNQATVICDRVESVGRSERRETFDVVTARAVAELPTLLEWSLPLLRVGGRLLAMKGPKVADELPACRSLLRPLGADEPNVHPVDVPQLPGRCVVEVVKTASTDPSYPSSPTRARRKRP